MQLKQKGKASEISKALHNIRRGLITKLPMPPTGNMHHQFTFSQMNVMTVLNEKGSMTMRDLANSSGVATPSMTDMITRLVRQKIVIRTGDKEDRRIIRVQLTDKGKKSIKQFHDMSGIAIALLFDQLVVADQQIVLKGLQIMDHLLKDDKKISKLIKMRKRGRGQ